jgi:hypothetical protein
MFLTKREIARLTGTFKENEQVDWLINNGFVFKVNGQGEPIVLKKQIEQLFGIDNARQASRQPNEAALKKRMGIM